MPLFTSSIELSDDYPSIRPSLNLNFAGSRALDPRITFTRASVGTYVDGNGQFKTVGNNEARFDHDPLTLESLGLLIEESRTNLVNNNTNPSSWIAVASAVNETTYPIKGLATTRVTDSPSDGDSPYLGAVSWGTGSSIPLCMSIYVDAVNSTSDTITLFLFGSGYINHTWNISTGVPVPTESFSINGSNYNSGSQEFIDCGGGIYRLILKANFTGSLVSGACRFYLAPSGGPTDYAIIAGPQIEQGAFPTSYIPTSGSSVTRQIDNAYILNDNVPIRTGVGEYSFYVRGRLLTTAPLFGISRGLVGMGNSTSNRIRIPHDSQGAVEIYSGNSLQVSFNTGSFGTVERKVALAVKKDDFALSLDGGTVLTDTSGNIPVDITTIGFGQSGYDAPPVTNPSTCYIKEFRIYPKRLTDAQLQLLTS
jgi:hypothetical protein